MTECNIRNEEENGRKDRDNARVGDGKDDEGEGDNKDEDQDEEAEAEAEEEGVEEREDVTILFLGSTLFLISSFCTTSPFPGSLCYAYYHYLLILGPLTFTMCAL